MPKVTLEVTKDGWVWKVFGPDGKCISERGMTRNPNGYEYNAIKKGDVYEDLEPFDLIDLAEAIEDGDPMDICKNLNEF